MAFVDLIVQINLHARHNKPSIPKYNVEKQKKNINSVCIERPITYYFFISFFFEILIVF